MGVTFKNLLDNTASEIIRRDSAYFERFPIPSVEVEEMAARYAAHPLCGSLPSRILEGVLCEGLTYFAGSRCKSEQSTHGSDPVIQLLCDSIVDAWCAENGSLDLLPRTQHLECIEEIFKRFYSERLTTGGLRYFVRNGNTRPLLLVNSAAVAIGVWRSFLADSNHDFKIIVPERRGADLFRGGLHQYVDIKEESADLAAILEAESIEKIDVMAWCNGARLAIDLAVRHPSQISSLVLVSPTFKGITGSTLPPGRFEQDMQLLFDTVTKQPDLAPFFSTAVLQQTEPPDWKRLTGQDSERARVLFELPAREHVHGILAPLTQPVSFTHMARRVASDDAHPTKEMLARLKVPTMIIFGSHDQIVNNKLTSWATGHMSANALVVATLMGGGHYIHDLQYHYFRLLLAWFLRGRPLPLAARISAATCSDRKLMSSAAG